MSDLVLIVTRGASGEWDTAFWGSSASSDKSFLAFKDNAGELDKFTSEAVLGVLNGTADFSQIAAKIRADIDNRSIISVVHGEYENTKKIVSLLGLQNPSRYSLGDGNNSPDNLGALVKNLAGTIKNTNATKEFTKNLEALKSAIRGDRLSKAMGSFLEALSPLSLMQDQTTIDCVRKSLDGLSDAVKHDLSTIPQDMGEGLLGLAENIRRGESDEVVGCALQNDSMLKFLARGYL